MSRKLSPEVLTFIAEGLGRRNPPPLRWLRVLANHPAPVVREGVVYGLAPHLDHIMVREVIKRIAYGDDHPAVRTAAQEALE